MDWGLILFVLGIVFLIGHLVFDGYRTLRNLRFIRHTKMETAGAENLDGVGCPRCVYIQGRLADMRHEVFWAVAAVVALTGHITLDFVA